MKVAGVAWVISSGAMCSQSRREPKVRSIAQATEHLSTVTRAGGVRNATQSPVQALNSRRWARPMFLGLRAFANTLTAFINKMPSMPGQRDVDVLRAQQYKRKQDSSGSFPGELSADELRKEQAGALARRKIMSHKYTGH